MHDIIQLARVYMPLQQALLDFMATAQQPDVQGVLSHLVSARLLEPRRVAQTLDVLDRDGPETSLVLLLALLYAARVDLLKERRSSGGGAGEEEEEEGAAPFWLRMLLQAVEEHGGRGFSVTVPQSVLTAETWAAACGEFCESPTVRNDG